MRVAVAVVVLSTLGAGAGAGASAPAVAPHAPPPIGPATTGHGPGALFASRPALPTPPGWTFPDAFPAVAGTGAQGSGAYYWTDFLYDDRGGRGRTTRSAVTPLAPSHGTYEYGAPAAAGNGADIFRSAVGRDGDATVWRVDWNTLSDPSVPIAVWTIDADRNTNTGASAWPASAGIRSAGIDHAIVVSAAGARVVDLASGSTTAELSTEVHLAARSFIVRVPRSALPLDGTSRVRLAAGVADRTGTAFEAVPPTLGGVPGGASAYNVAFRRRDQEPTLLGTPRSPQTTNPWMEGAQAAALTSGDVSAFFAEIDWSAIERAVAEPRIEHGWINRWYVSSVEVGAGVVWDPPTGMDLRPNYLGRVQPYAMYVPSSYDGSAPAPLTWLLHSAFQGHNAYGVMTPRFVERACEARKSICVTPLGRGHDGWYFEEAELDFWEVWNDVTRHYRIDTDRVVIGGFSMGGYGAYRLGFSHPDLFAAGFAIGATPSCGRNFSDGVEVPAGTGRCTTDGDTTDLVASARWVPYYIAHGTTDELLPITGTIDHVGAFDAHGLRYRFDHFVGQPHIPWYGQDMWGPIADALGDPRRETAPARVSLRWRPHADRPDLGLTTTGAYWIDDVYPRDVSPGALAALDAHSASLPDPAVEPVRSQTVITPSDATPAHSQRLEWRFGAERPRARMVSVEMTNVASMTLALQRAGIHPGGRATVELSTDGPTSLALAGAAGPVVVDGARVGTAHPHQAFVITVAAGTSRIDIG